jgi:rfaE bifunctional protein nucleotidyltransferase chain/domain
MIRDKIVYVQGTWDLFHVGHINILRKARRMARELIAGVNTDDSVKRYKGHFPVISYRDRIKTLKACRYVDRIIKSDLIFDINKLKRHKIEVLVLGSDWKGKYLAGVNEAREIGIRIIYFAYTKDTSTTKIKERIKNER